ncbi:hypothetical protein ABNC73_11650, partial [Paenibacillus larvae]
MDFLSVEAISLLVAGSTFLSADFSVCYFPADSFAFLADETCLSAGFPVCCFPADSFDFLADKVTSLLGVVRFAGLYHA